MLPIRNAAGVALAGLILLISMDDLEAQPAGYNYDESKVPTFTLPDPLVDAAGNRVTSSEGWTGHRRAEVLGLFEDHMFGRQPGRPKEMEFELIESSDEALGGKAVRKQIRIHVLGKGGPAMDVLMYLPRNVAKAPLFVGYNFQGNHTVNADPAIRLAESWVRSRNDETVEDNRATEKGRGVASSRWPMELIVERGFGVATIYYGDIEPDHSEGWENGVRALIKTDASGKPLELEEWSAISAWAWGLSRVMDYLETDARVDAQRVAVIGHSRLGKTALWAGATDERFALVVSNNSGCGGAALSRRAFGETVTRINTSFPHWFCGKFKSYNDNENALPIDQHELVALMAPRPVYVASATEDRWADPKGEFLSAKLADEVYALFGKDGVGVEEQPAPDTPVGATIGYHLRQGGHDITAYDWTQYMNFAERNW